MTSRIPRLGQLNENNYVGLAMAVASFNIDVVLVALTRVKCVPLINF